MSLLATTDAGVPPDGTVLRAQAATETAGSAADSSTNPAHASSSPDSSSNPLSSSSPFDKLPDELVSRIISLTFGKSFEYMCQPYTCLVSRRFHRLSTPFHYRSLPVSPHAANHFLRRPWTFPLVRIVTLPLALTLDDNYFTSGVMALFARTTSVTITFPRSRKSDADGSTTRRTLSGRA